MFPGEAVFNRLNNRALGNRLTPRPVNFYTRPGRGSGRPAEFCSPAHFIPAPRVIKFVKQTFVTIQRRETYPVAYLTFPVGLSSFHAHFFAVWRHTQNLSNCLNFICPPYSPLSSVNCRTVPPLYVCRGKDRFTGLGVSVE